MFSRAAAILHRATRSNYRACLTVESVVSVESAPLGIRMDQEGSWHSVGSLPRTRGSSMSMANRRSWQKHHVGHVHLTVEAEPTDIDRNLDRHRGLASVTEQLFQMLNRHKLPATWAVGDPANSAVAALVAGSETRHGLAVLGDRHWIGKTAGRTRFARELARRVTQARRAGIEVVTFVPRVAPVTEHIDLVVKSGIQAVVDSQQNANARPTRPSPRALHYGVWEFSATNRLPLRSSWLPGSNWKLARNLRRAGKDAATIHLVIDVPAIEVAGYTATQRVEWIMRRVAKLRDRGVLQVETLGTAAARLSDLPAAKPQRSILRQAG
jgi:hypothetical protein